VKISFFRLLSYTIFTQNALSSNEIIFFWTEFFGAFKVHPSLFTIFFFTVPLLLPTCLYCSAVVFVFLIILVRLLLLFLSVVVLKHVIILLCTDKLLTISFYVCDFHSWALHHISTYIYLKFVNIFNYVLY